jgi:hypothetical protein
MNALSKIIDGIYNVEVSDIYLRNRKDGQGSYIVLDLKIIDGDYKGRIIPEVFSFHALKVKDYIYKMEEMLESCKIELEDSDYDKLNSILNALTRTMLHKTLCIRFQKNGSHVRIDFLHIIKKAPANTADHDNEPVDLSEIDLSEIPF